MESDSFSEKLSCLLSSHCCAFPFSWSPRGVLLAAHSPAKYIKDGKVREVEIIL